MVTTSHLQLLKPARLSTHPVVRYGALSDTADYTI